MAQVPESGLAAPTFPRRRPCLLIAAFFVGGIVLGRHVLHLSAHTLPWFLAGTLVLIAVSVAAKRPEAAGLLYLAVAAMGVARVCLEAESRALQRQRMDAALIESQPEAVRAVVVEEPVSRGAIERTVGAPFYAPFLAQVTSVRADEVWQPLRGKVLVTFVRPTGPFLHYGDEVILRAKFQWPEPARNPGSFDMRRYFGARGVYVVASVSDAEEIEPTGRGRGSVFWHAVYRVREALRARLTAGTMATPSRALLNGMVLGDRQFVERTLMEALADTNTIHVLAISGLNLGILAVAVLGALRLALVPQRVARTVTVALLLFYSALTGFEAPVSRTLVMATVFLLAPVFGREADGLNALSLAAIVLLAISPLDLFQASFQLTFLVVLVMVLLTTPVYETLVAWFNLRPDPGYLTISRLRRALNAPVRWVVAMAVASMCATIGSLPVVQACYHGFMPMGLLANFLVVPLVAFVVPLGFAGAALGLVWGPLAAALNALNGVLLDAMRTVVEAVSTGNHVRYAETPSLLLTVGYYASLVVVGLWPQGRRWKWIPLALFLIALVALAYPSARPPREFSEVVLFDTVRGGTAFVDLPNRKTMLIDAEPAQDWESRAVLLPFLRARGVNRLDAVVLSERSRRLWTGLDGLSRRVAVEEIVASEWAADETVPAYELESLCQRTRIPLTPWRAQDVVAFSPWAELTLIVEAAGQDLRERHDPTLAVRFVCDEGSLLLVRRVGPQPRNGAGGLDFETTVLYLRPGSCEESDAEWLIDRTHPRAVVFGVEPQGRAKGPPPDLVTYCKERGITVLRTDETGAVSVFFDGSGVWCRAMLGPHARAD